MASATALLRRASFFLLDKYTVCLHPQLCPSFPAPPSLPKSPPQPHAEHLNYAWQQSIELRARHRQPVCPDGLAMPCSPLPPTPPPLPASSQGARVSICLRASHPLRVARSQSRGLASSSSCRRRRRRVLSSCRSACVVACLRSTFLSPNPPPLSFLARALAMKCSMG